MATPLDDKGIIAFNIVIYYGPIPKNKHKQTNEDIKTNSKVTLFTNTMYVSNLNIIRCYETLIRIG